MKVHFSAPLQDLDDHISAYESIVGSIKSSGHSLVKDWLQEYHSTKARDQYFSDEEWKRINDATLEAVQSADAVIIEASISSFSMGYIAAKALAHKKPLLMLFDTHPQPYILNSSNTLKRSEVYRSNEELQKIVTTFLKEIDVDANNLRFNMVLDREVYNFLNWESVNTGKTKAQIVREVLKERIRRKG
jgi:hypothetical protein